MLGHSNLLSGTRGPEQPAAVNSQSVPGHGAHWSHDDGANGQRADVVWMQTGSARCSCPSIRARPLPAVCFEAGTAAQPVAFHATALRPLRTSRRPRPCHQSTPISCEARLHTRSHSKLILPLCNDAHPSVATARWRTAPSHVANMLKGCPASGRDAPLAALYPTARHCRSAQHASQRQTKCAVIGERAGTVGLMSKCAL